MHCVTGKIIELYMEGELPMAKVGVHGAFLRVPVSFTQGAKVGDFLLIESGVAIAIVPTPISEEQNNVSGDTGQGHRH
mgnify:CR=1 FL=1